MHDDGNTSGLPNALTLAGHALVGAAIATLVLAGIESATLDGISNAPADSAFPSSRACTLTASPATCDECMLANCARPCRACADNPHCLRLFSCLMECADARCESQCVAENPDGKADLEAFLGEGGCLVRACQAACP